MIRLDVQPLCRNDISLPTPLGGAVARVTALHSQASKVAAVGLVVNTLVVLCLVEVGWCADVRVNGVDVRVLCDILNVLIRTVSFEFRNF